MKKKARGTPPLPLKPLEKEAKALMLKWQPELFLHDWFFELLFPDEPFNGEKEVDKRTTLASISVDPVYQKAWISIYPSWFKAPSDVREHAMVHELCHCLTQRIWDLSGVFRDGGMVSERELSDSIENLTQKISYVAMRGRWPARTFPKERA